MSQIGFIKCNETFHNSKYIKAISKNEKGQPVITIANTKHANEIEYGGGRDQNYVCDKIFERYLSLTTDQILRSFNLNK